MSSNLVPVTETAKLVRKFIKEELGLSTRKFTIKCEDVGNLSDSLSIQSKSEEITPEILGKIAVFAKKFQSFDRCDASGEILSGGNTFVSIRNHHGFIKNWDLLLKDAGNE